MRTELELSMELLSDTIFGSGYSIPGGEDISVVADAQGYPYVPGTVLKGLLRESLENCLAWAGADAALAELLLGASGWQGEADARRVQITELALADRRLAPEDCYCSRVFTQVEGGVAKAGSLRSASCIKSGLRFCGRLECAAADVPLLEEAFAGIKWAGAMRSRGFGRVRFSLKPAAAKSSVSGVASAACLCYRLHLETPLIITDFDRSTGNDWDVRGVIPGSAVRGMLISALAEREPAWFEENRVALLSAKTRFLDAFPAAGELAAIPSIKGFYEDKQEQDFCSVLQDGSVPPGYKRAKLGSFCALEGDTVRYWSARTGGRTRIQRNINRGEDSEPFRTRHIEAGQDFVGCITLSEPGLAAAISHVLRGSVWLGADRYEGYGKCTVTSLAAAAAPAYQTAYGYHDQAEVGRELYLLAVSPLTMLNEKGEPCGIDLAALAGLLGVGAVELLFCSTSVAVYGSYNRTWQCREAALPFYDRGSIFRLQCSEPPALEKLRALERAGLGIRTAEGFGDVLFLRPKLFTAIRRKSAAERALPQAAARVAQRRRERYAWIMRQAEELKHSGNALSPSQLGTIQTECEKALRRGGDTAQLYAFLNKNLNERGSRHGERFKHIDKFIRGVMEQQRSADGVLGSYTDTERLALLCQLFDYSRKGE